MSTGETLTRLLKALDKDPVLSYLLWKRMGTLRFHGPWVTLRVDDTVEQVLMDENGHVVGHVEEAGNCWSWGIPDGDGAEVWTEAEAKQQVEERVWADGWRQVPTDLWVPPKNTPVYPPAEISPWTLAISGTGTWLRFYRSQAVAARVGCDSPQSLAQWVVWSDERDQNNLAGGSAPSIEEAKHEADLYLVGAGLLPVVDEILNNMSPF